MKLVVVDIDGSIACLKERYALASEPKRGNKKDFQQWLDKIQSPEMLLQDRVIGCMQPLIKLLHDSGHRIVYLTGRSEKYRKVTRKWLKDNKFPFTKLVMRSNNDWRPPALYKEAKLVKEIKVPNEPWLVIDDDYSSDCSIMYRRHGATHLKVMGDSV